ncbi:hypothetical protein ACFQV8_24155 [Pseudonocardia benzenivorans]
MSVDAATGPAGILVEAEEFDDLGGWAVDSQFELQMGSPYLLAHGLGRPVADASTTVAVPEAGTYRVWVRAKDWVPAHHPGRFTLAVGGTVLDTVLGANGRDWSWQDAGTVDLAAGPVRLVLHDLTGFDGRCDAIYLAPVGGPGDVAPPEGPTRPPAPGGGGCAVCPRSRSRPASSTWSSSAAGSRARPRPCRRPGWDCVWRCCTTAPTWAGTRASRWG